MSASKPAGRRCPAGAEAEAENIAADICVIGAGPGGLAVATAAAAFGRKVVLVERHKFGGEALEPGMHSVACLGGGGQPRPPDAQRRSLRRRRA